jgi:hypothetical protein
MRRHLFILVILAPTLCFAAGSYSLKSELHTNYLAGASKLFTVYSYDNGGMCTLKRVFNGVDSTTSLLSRQVFTYDASLRLIKTILASAEGETLSITMKNYGPAGLTDTSILNKNGGLRFKDSIIYINGIISEQRRYNSALSLTSFHHFTYTSSLLTADTLFETDGVGGFVASNATVFSYNADSTTSSKKFWLKQDASWYAIKTTKMTYVDGFLDNVSTYEADGSSNRMIDSIAFVYDNNGNRIKELRFDNERSLVYDIVYKWYDPKSAVVIQIPQIQLTKPEVVFKNGILSFSSPFTGTVSIYTPSGCLTSRQMITNQKTATLSCKQGYGRYIVQLRGSSNQSSVLILK